MHKVEQIRVREDGGPMEGTISEHPAFGQIGASRVSGGAVLYGSDFQHQNYVTIRIGKSQLRRTLSNDWFFSSGLPYVEVDVSEAQWATFVSSMNIGSGVPCTVRFANGELMPRLPEPESRKDQFKNEANETCKESLDRIKELCAMIEASGLGKKAKEELVKQAQRAAASMTSSLPFVLDQFGEHMEHTVEKAKIEINAYAMQNVVRAGIGALTNGGTELPVIGFGDK